MKGETKREGCFDKVFAKMLTFLDVRTINITRTKSLSFLAVMLENAHTQKPASIITNCMSDYCLSR